MDKIDLTTFKQNNDNHSECQEEQHMECKSMKRLLVALKQYSMLNVIEDESDREFLNVKIVWK